MRQDHAPNPDVECERHQFHARVQMTGCEMQSLLAIASSVAISSGLGLPDSSKTMTGVLVRDDPCGNRESWSPTARQFGGFAKVDHVDHAASWICAGAGASPRASSGPGGAFCIA